ncbi:MAG: hypothetical protein UU49_C0011G0022 [Candidatus Magasanikbacteria bacterium GW2011_GWC2_41_17]|uniref:Uncharacterized protein n=2 Tax=Candidatus Magasanikiibacteriota TaxID=1752731 RepID=A0A0G0WM43_9BACT|nr:MAG: hypothetical protein UU49_C0011G0022 [Candidatus Magasanikbacteria bacterium GW2011_GWC2_41_17]KKS13122.1 MAG: hypothetical protein UU69_C0013G0012 [Candidatus Magasanikbacteria bacterium GW2011_GWA2_41_55]
MSARPVNSLVPDRVLAKAIEITGRGCILWIPNEKRLSGHVMIGDTAIRWPLEIFPERWVFFCDDNPAAMWGHACRILLITDDLVVEVRRVTKRPNDLRQNWTSPNNPFDGLA